MINWDSLTIDRILVHQYTSKLDILLIMITTILPLTILFLFFNKNKKFSLKEFVSFMFWSILLKEIFITFIKL